MKKILIITVLLVTGIAGIGQTATGKWKLVVGYTVSYADTKDDFLKAMYKEQPCLQKIVYVFSAAGKIDVEKNHCEHVDPGGTAAFGTKYVVPAYRSARTVAAIWVFNAKKCFFSHKKMVF